MFFLGRRSKTAKIERELSDAGGRAVDTISELAEHAVHAAREASRAAAPAVQHSAEAMAKAFEKAAETLSETGGKFARSEAGITARRRLADASEGFAQSIRPKKRHHRIRNLLIASAVIGGIVAFVQSPLRTKLTERLFGPSPEDEPESIQLPGSDSYSDTSSVTGGDSNSSYSSPSETTGGGEEGEETAEASAAEGDGVASAQSGRDSQS
jgi:hypothetical protein